MCVCACVCERVQCEERACVSGEESARRGGSKRGRGEKRARRGEGVFVCVCVSAMGLEGGARKGHVRVCVCVRVRCEERQGVCVWREAGRV